jgi:hypothetical protein
MRGPVQSWSMVVIWRCCSGRGSRNAGGHLEGFAVGAGARLPVGARDVSPGCSGRAPRVLQWARARNCPCPWGAATCSSPLNVGTWRCCGGLMSTTACGNRECANSPLGTGTWSLSGRTSTVASGVRRHAMGRHLRAPRSAADMRWAREHDCPRSEGTALCHCS